MNDARKTKAQLIEELQALRAQVGGDPVGSRRLLAAERVRAEALAMRTSDDLHRVVAVLFHEMVAAGVESPCCSAQLYDFEEGVYDSFSAFVKPPRQDPSITSDALVDFDEEIGTTHISYSSAELQAISSAQFQDGVSRWRAGEPWSVPVTGSEPFSRIFHRLHSQLGFAGGFPGWEGDWVVTNVPFQYGSIAFRERQERPEHIDIARQLTQALAIGYRRFLDFQRLEEQNRRLEIEQILERVRGQALGMHRSDDLAAVAVTVFDELRALGVAIWRCGFFIFNDAHDPPEMEAWLTTAEGEPVRARWTYVLDAGAHPYMTGIYATWKRGEHRCNYLVGGDVVGLANHLIDRGLPFPVGREPGLEDEKVEVWFNYLFFQHGYLHAATLERLPAERLDVLEQLAVIFGVAYSRFLELRQMEEHARQTERRAAVDRVRAEIATMRTSADLEHVTPLIWKELVDAGVSFFRCGVFIAAEGGERVRAYLTNPQGQSLGVLDLAADSHPVFGRVLKSWRAEQALTEQWDQATFMQWMDSLQAQRQNVERGRFQGAEQPPESLSLHFVPFAQGMLYVGSAAPLPEQDLSLLQEVTTAFSVAYARYLDFAQLEEQNRALAAANAQVEQASLNKSQFLRRMSHDLRSPMNAIVGYSRLLQRRLADRMNEREARNLANIEASSGNLLKLINDILDLSRIEAGRLEVEAQPVDVRTLADECADALASIVREGVELRRELTDVGAIRTNPDRLRQVVMNLLGNATKFTETGSITLTLRKVESLVELSIADTGVGIPAQDLPHIFDEFRQVARQGGEHTEGTGLGLAIASKTVDLLGGTISATSEAGVGTTFTLRVGDYE